MKLWVGKEKEGYYNDCLTLFVGSKDITLKEIDNVINQYDKLEQIYFGAGRCTSINQNVVRECIKKDKFIITMEINICDLHKYDKNLLNDVEVMMTIDNKNFLIFKDLGQMSQIKLQSVDTNEKVILMSDRGMFDKVDIKTLKGKMYKGDKVIK